MSRTNDNGYAGNGNGLAHMPAEVDSDLCSAAVEEMDDRAGRYCSAERQRLEAANQPKIAAAKQDLTMVECGLERITRETSKLPPEGDLRKRRRIALFLFAFGLGLCTAGFARQRIPSIPSCQVRPSILSPWAWRSSCPTAYMKRSTVG